MSDVEQALANLNSGLEMESLLAISEFFGLEMLESLAILEDALISGAMPRDVSIEVDKYLV